MSEAAQAAVVPEEPGAWIWKSPQREHHTYDWIVVVVVVGGGLQSKT